MTRGKQIIEEAKRIIAEAHERGSNDPMVDLTITLSFTLGARWADKNPHWISVEDKLPKEYEEVLAIANVDGNIVPFVGVCENGMFYFTEPTIRKERRVTHWIPLPAPPTCSEKPNNSKKGGNQ